MYGLFMALPIINTNVNTDTSHKSPAQPAYQARLATTAEIKQAQALRFEVFNLELNEGLIESYDVGLDVDAFDAVCAHLIVECVGTGEIIGTYRMQTGLNAQQHLGYYSEREFDFAPFEPMRSQVLELGRACISADHRNFAVLNLLWKGIASYAENQGTRYLIGCSSLTSQDKALGAAAYQAMSARWATKPWQTLPQPGYECIAVPYSEKPKIPRLLSAYLALGASICSPPAIDRAFKTIDFLTMLDVRSPNVVALQQRGRFTA